MYTIEVLITLLMGASGKWLSNYDTIYVVFIFLNFDFFQP